MVAIIMSTEDNNMSSDDFSQRLKTKPNLLYRVISSKAFQFSLDLFVTLTAFYLLVVNKFGVFPDSYLMLGALTTLLMFTFYYNRDTYQNHKRFISGSLLIIKAWIFVTISIIIIAFLTKQSATYSREVVVSWFFVGAVAQIAIHAGIRALVGKIRKTDSIVNALVIGGGEISKYLTEQVNNNPWVVSKIVGVIDDDDATLSKWSVENVPVLGKIKDLSSLFKKYEIKSIYISLPLTETEVLQQIYIDCLENNINVILVPPLFDVTLINYKIKQIGNIPIISLSESPLTGRRAKSKKIIDYILAFTVLFLLSPLMIAVAIAIKLTSQGPIFFKQKRHGWHGEIIDVWKFRSMYLHKENEGEITQAIKDDPRATKIGRIIRKTSIDELPQLFNILNGTMSLVGPRPHPVEKNHYYSEKIDDYMSRHNIKPGITGLAQVNNCRGETKEIKDMQRRIDYDLEYINNWSNMLDIKIIIKTILVLYSDKAY